MIQYVHNTGYTFPYHFIMPKFGHSALQLEWLTERAAPGFINTAGPADAPENAKWWYNGRTIGVKDRDLAIEFRLRWC
jgi:hypothetical protein